MKNEDQNCTFSVPENEFGIVAMHCFDNQKFENEDLGKIFAGPLAAIEPAYQKELAKAVEIKNDEH